MEEENETGVVKEGFNVYHTGHLAKPKFPTIKGALDFASQPQKAEVMDTYYIAPIPQRAFVWTPPPPPITHYRLHYSRVDRYFH
ncbi:unnamed protein product [Allacma fusca]|uniref:Uncharacterized protein n=1 Tax=Allacma fusca TaxID=39272 RepID=A0A8J2PME1_9HEXA|nr:unnamed protein product [Allacma fusca]